MTWVRYDDKFHSHAKVVEVIDADPGALALHLVANTWTAASRTPGWVPASAARRLVGNKAKRWAAVLSEAGLWDAGELDGKPGWWVHDFEIYNPVDAETKRRRSDSARKAANARWHPNGAPPHADRMPDAYESDTDAVPSDAIARGHPDPVTNSTTSKGSPTVPAAGIIPKIIRLYVESARDAGVAAPEESQGRVERSARSLLGQGYTLADVEDAARNAAVNGWTDLAIQLQRDTARASPATANGSTTDKRYRDALTLADQLDQKAIG